MLSFKITFLYKSANFRGNSEVSRYTMMDKTDGLDGYTQVPNCLITNEAVNDLGNPPVPHVAYGDNPSPQATKERSRTMRLTIFSFALLTSVALIACGSPPDDGDDTVDVDAVVMTTDGPTGQDGPTPMGICTEAIRLSNTVLSCVVPVQFNCRVADMPPENVNECTLDCNPVDGGGNGFQFTLPLGPTDGTLTINMVEGFLSHSSNDGEEQLHCNFPPSSP